MPGKWEPAQYSPNIIRLVNDQMANKKLEKLRNTMEGNARGSGLEGGEHGSGRQGAKAVLVIQRIHGRQQARPALLVLQPVEQVERV